jgi:pyruvate formate lyase activating enzyme
MNGDEAGVIVSVQHFCVHDGPGTRSVVFFKGCPLRCAWCSNPEAWQREPQLAHKQPLCLQTGPVRDRLDCQRCVEACPKHAMATPGSWDPELCDHCGACADACPTQALVLLGQHKSVEQLLAALRPEIRLYQATEGGVTLSGGEATLQARFALGLTRALVAEGVHVAVETCGLYNRDDADVQALLTTLQLVLFDIKLFDDAEHRRWCGAGNRHIQANLAALQESALAGRGPAVWARMPLIPSVTATPANVDGWATWLAARGFTRLTLVPYHEYGAGKRAWLGPGTPPAPSLPRLDDELLASVRARFAERGIDTCAPGHELH